MTKEAAHKFMENEIRCMQRECNGICTRECSECEFNRDDNLLMEVYGMSVLALEKQIPRKPQIVHCKNVLDAGWRYTCSGCGTPIGENKFSSGFTGKYNYCEICGQRQDWSDYLLK